MTHCDIVIPVWNQLEMTRACLNSVLEHTDVPYRLIIIDNGSEKETAAYLGQFSEEHEEIVHLIRNDVNEGYIKATNRGMKASNGRYVCLLSNDTVVYPNWLSSMIEIAELESDIGLVNPASNHFGYSGISDVPKGPSLYIGMGRCIGFCMLIKRELIDKIGFLDERFGMGYGEDDAYSVSAHKEGYRCVMAKKAYVYHIGKKTFGRDTKAREHRERQRSLAKELLGEQPKVEFFLFNRPGLERNKEVIQLIQKLADKGIRCKVFYGNNLPLPEHTFIVLRDIRPAWLYFSSVFRFFFDRRFHFFATDNLTLFKMLKRLNFLKGKKLLLFSDKIYFDTKESCDYGDNQKVASRLRSINISRSVSDKAGPGAENKIIKIGVITPTRKIDYLADTILDGLFQMQKKDGRIEFFISSKYPAVLPDAYFLPKRPFINFCRDADLILFLWGKKNTDYDLAYKINCWAKTVFIDGSELRAGLRLNKETIEQVKGGNYNGIGAIDKDMLDKCALYFRRENPYLDGIVPLPFGINSYYSKFYEKNKTKDIDFTCIFGQEGCPPLRREVRERLEGYCKEKGFTYRTAKTSNPDEFYEILSRTKVGVSVSGAGYDTARFWEILGNNCFLLTEAIDIFRPEDNALNYKRIFEFKDINEFEGQLQKIASYLRNGYDQNELGKEFEQILAQHSSMARVLKILNKAKEKNILRDHNV